MNRILSTNLSFLLIFSIVSCGIEETFQEEGEQEQNYQDAIAGDQEAYLDTINENDLILENDEAEFTAEEYDSSMQSPEFFKKADKPSISVKIDEKKIEKSYKNKGKHPYGLNFNDGALMIYYASNGKRSDLCESSAQSFKIDLSLANEKRSVSKKNVFRPFDKKKPCSFSLRFDLSQKEMEYFEKITIAITAQKSNVRERASISFPLRDFLSQVTIQ